jgi:hypothetical protein
VLLALFFSVTGSCTAQQKLTAEEGKAHVGERATVCGSAVGTHYATTSRGQPTFINIDQPYPRQIFTILIWGSDRSKFGTPEKKYSGKQVCVTGEISSYRGVSEIIVHDPGSIIVQ